MNLIRKIIKLFLDKNKLISIVFVLLLLGITILYGSKPEYNWDTIPYMASTLKIDNSNSKQIHKQVYNIVRTELTEEDFKRLTSGNEYRKQMEINTVAFMEQIPFYNIKFVYVYLIYFFYIIGFSLSFSTVLPSIISIFLIGLLLLFTLNYVFRIEYAALLSIFIILLTPMRHLARYSTPDALSSLALLLVVIAFIKNKYLLLLSMIINNK